MPNWNLELVIGGMPIGSSFFVPCVQCQGLMRHVAVLGKSYGVVLRCGIRFEDHIKGIRVWRIE
jgi:hypothetical protein